jgi:hypothetical protein
VLDDVAQAATTTRALSETKRSEWDITRWSGEGEGESSALTVRQGGQHFLHAFYFSGLISVNIGSESEHSLVLS